MFILSKFAERLKEFMDEKGLKAPALARELNTDRSNITRYLRGERAPQYANFLAMVNYFNCSADYLLGLVDYPPQNVTLHEPRQPFKDRFRYVIEFCGFNQYKLEQSDEFAGSAIFHWLAGNKLPSVESLVNLAKFLGCTVDFLIGRAD